MRVDMVSDNMTVTIKFSDRSARRGEKAGGFDDEKHNSIADKKYVVSVSSGEAQNFDGR